MNLDKFNKPKETPPHHSWERILPLKNGIEKARTYEMLRLLFT